MGFRLIAKIGLLLVVIGFFLPIADGLSGFRIVDGLFKSDQVRWGLLFCVVVLAAIIGIFIGISILMNREPSDSMDWFAIIACIVSGLYIYFKLKVDVSSSQPGVYFILAGWVVSLSFQILSKIRGE